MKLIDDARNTYESCSKQFDNQSKLITTLKLDPSFETWFTFLILHLWLIERKSKTLGTSILLILGDYGKQFQQEMFNHLWLDVEIKLHNAKATQISKITQNLLASYYGHMLSYNEGLSDGAPTLAAALWRNVLFARGDITAHQLHELLDYTVRRLHEVDAMHYCDGLLI
jgi:hypothetical protein